MKEQSQLLLLAPKCVRKGKSTFTIPFHSLRKGKSTFTIPFHSLRKGKLTFTYPIVQILGAKSVSTLAKKCFLEPDLLIGWFF